MPNVNVAELSKYVKAGLAIASLVGVQVAPGDETAIIQAGVLIYGLLSALEGIYKRIRGAEAK